jgi:hypothetical protein
LALIGGGILLVVVGLLVIGIVMVVRTSPRRPGNTPPTSNTEPTGNTVTRAHFDRLRSGMTEAQVIAIMGPPAAAENHDDAQGKSRQLVWRNGNEYITVAFVGGASSPPSARIGGDYLFGRR